MESVLTVIKNNLTKYLLDTVKVITGRDCGGACITLVTSTSSEGKCVVRCVIETLDGDSYLAFCDVDKPETIRVYINDGYYRDYTWDIKSKMEDASYDSNS